MQIGKHRGNKYKSLNIKENLQEIKRQIKKSRIKKKKSMYLSKKKFIIKQTQNRIFNNCRRDSKEKIEMSGQTQPGQHFKWEAEQR